MKLRRSRRWLRSWSREFGFCRQAGRRVDRQAGRQAAQCRGGPAPAVPQGDPMSHPSRAHLTSPHLAPAQSSGGRASPASRVSTPSRVKGPGLAVGGWVVDGSVDSWVGGWLELNCDTEGISLRLEQCQVISIPSSRYKTRRSQQCRCRRCRSR